MAIKNPDGSVYQPSGSLQQFDPTNLEHDLFNLWDQEVIEIGGAPIDYHNLFINISNIDELYVEARDKVWSKHPVQIYGFYNPIPSSNMLGMFGIDSPDEIMFEFNYRHVLKTLGHVPKIGARLYTPHKGENWVIIQRNVEVFKLWGELRLQLMCMRFQESLTTGEGKVTQNRRPDFKINSIKDLSKKKMNLAEGQPQVP
jgi:hypothetical protein